MTALRLHRTGEVQYFVPYFHLSSPNISLHTEYSTRFSQVGSDSPRKMECNQEMQPNSEWSFDDDNFCDPIYSDDNSHTSSVSGAIVARSAHAQSDQPDRFNMLCESTTVIAKSADVENNEMDYNKASSESASSESTTVVVRREDALYTEGRADLSSLAEDESVQLQASDEEEMPMIPVKCTKIIKVVTKRPVSQDVRRAAKVTTVQKKKN